MKYKRNTPALIRDKLRMKDCIIRNLNKKCDEYRDEIEQQEMMQRIYEYQVSKGRMSFPFSYEK